MKQKMGKEQAHSHKPHFLLSSFPFALQNGIYHYNGEQQEKSELMWEASGLMKHIKIKHHYNHSEGKGGVNVRYREQIIIIRN